MSYEMPQVQTDAANTLELVKHYRKFFKWAWHIISQEKPVWNWHIDYIANELQYLASYIIAREGSPYDMIINVPPGMTKSSLITQVWPIWMWLHDPTICIIITSYSDGLSLDHSLKSKSIILSEEFYYFNQYIMALHGEPLQLIKDTEKYWINNFGGFYYATSTGGTVTGKHANVLIRDDPLNPEQSESKPERLRCNRFNDRTLSTRKKDKAGTPTVTVMQRLHVNDPTGHDLAKQVEGLRIKHICLPAEKSINIRPVELEKKYDQRDGLLDPVRLNHSVLKEESIRLGSFGYAGQYQQTPSPEEGGKIKRDWFKAISESELPSELVWDIWIDGAYTKNTDNDPTGIVAIAYRDNKIYIRNAVSMWLEMPELLKYVVNYALINDLNGQSTTFVEPKASGKSLKQLLINQSKLNAVEIGGKLIKVSKEERIMAASPACQAGRVILVEGSWNDEFVGQLAEFPNALHDEYVDIIGYAVDYYLGEWTQGDYYDAIEIS